MERNAKKTKEGKLGKTKNHFTCFTMYNYSQPLKYGIDKNIRVTLVNVFCRVFHGLNYALPYQDDIDFMPKMMQHRYLTT